MDDFEKRYKEKHKKISSIKSGVRIGACLSAIASLMLFSPNLEIVMITFSIGFLIAEFLGIMEENI